MTGWYNSASTEKPQKIDAISSEIYVYIHKDIRQEEIDNLNGGKTTMYNYLEKKMTKDEFIAYSDLMETDEKTDEIEAQAMYTALMTDTLIEEDENV